MKFKTTHIGSYLDEPYPYYYGNTKRLILLLTLFSFLSFSFSYFFEPFEINVAEHKINSLWILVIHAFAPIPIAYLYLSIMHRRAQDEIKWTLGKEIIHLSSILFLIGVANFLIRDFIYTNPDNWSLKYLWEELRNTFLVGILLLFIVLPLNLERLINKHTSLSKELSLSYSELNTTASSILIKGALNNENFELLIQDFLFAKVEGNYTEIYTIAINEVHKQLLRITLKELEDQLKDFPEIYKSHRSYLVHLSAIQGISGNAQGYQLTIKNCPFKVPVSRSNITDFNKLHRNT